MTTCVINPLMMGAIPRQTYQEHGAKLMNDSDLMGEMKKQVQDSSYWPAIPTQALPTATTERSSRSALRALLQQPPPSSLVPDSRLESDTYLNDAIQPSWSQYPDQADFRTPNSLSDSKPFPQLYDTRIQSSEHQASDHQVGHQGFDMQPPISNPYQANYSYRIGLRQTQPVVGSDPFKQEQSDELEQLHQKQSSQTERTTRPDFPVGSPRAGSSLPKEFETMHMMAFAQKQMREHMKNRVQRRRSFNDNKNQTSPPKREGAGGSKLKFGITADGIPNSPDNHPTLHSQQPQQQQLLFSRGFLSTANQLHDQEMHTNNRGSPGRSSFSMETKIIVEDIEALVLKQFQKKVFQLDMGTRLGFQESLYRLARSARERQDSNRTSAEPDFAAMDMDSCDRPTSGPQSRCHIETQTNPVDRTLVNMLFFPLRVPGLQRPTDHSSWSRSRAVAARSNQGNWSWLIPATSNNMFEAQFHGSDGSGPAMEETTSRTVTPHMTWTGAPHLADYASTSPGSSPVDPSMLNNRSANVVNLTYGGPAAHTARQLGGIPSSTTKPVDIRAPRRCDSNSSIECDFSNSPSHGGQVLNFSNVGFHGPSSHSSQDTSSFVGDGQHGELAAGNHGMDQQHPSNHNFAMMNMNDDILGAAVSIQTRAEVNQIDQFRRPQSSSASPNANAKNVTVGFSPMLYEDHGSRFEGESRGSSLGSDSTSTGMSIFDQRSATVLRNMVDTAAYTRSSQFFQA